ncbi:ABC transporter ATP-binding protein [Tepidibacter hydrothermalis]|uniref:ABC transporter ATP-binding protein n=1 Tax=Tepidibacter hydrothermalis TaxID=3036126 RepID=A0ABY8EDW6_9FIRM|nr:ABC transporter ATP-binding protein [Tepidibacter hydrothermalis]WFD10966.1 ABC transporter ATP-binding protein [Tepidibacter hydrothermalis]
MIKLKNISKKYGDFDAVKNIDLKINKGEVFGFLGPNGAGKTTTLKMITGVLKSTSGDILINDIDINKKPIEAKKQFGFVPDSPDIFLKLTGIEYLNFIADIYNVSKEDREKRIEELSNKFEIKAALNDKIQSYSHGMRQKIVIIGVLLHKPPLWILDEPMTGLDPKSAHILKNMMREHVDEGNTVLFSTHVLEVAEKICDRVAIINKGEILFCGNLKEMKMQFQEDSSLEKMFLEITENE